jgi:hypothetical protein
MKTMNSVLKFLKETGCVHSFRNLKKRFKLKTYVLAKLLNHPQIVKGHPSEVGCGKHTMNLWKFDI